MLAERTLQEPPIRVLLIEYAKDITDMLELVLKMEGFTVQSAENGAEGLRLAAEFQPDAAVVDIGLPDMDGYEVAQKLRQLNPAILLVAYSGWIKEENFRRSQEAGFDHHLVKPTETEVITDLLAQAQRGSWR